MDIQYIILCPDRNLGGLKNTVGSIKFNTVDRNFLCVVGNDVYPDELEEFQNTCPTFVGKDTLTSLINLGLKTISSEWGFILFAGSRTSRYLENKLDVFAKNENDVLFPVVDYKTDFVYGSFNGVLINTQLFKKVGDFPTSIMKKKGVNDFEMAKMFWHISAVEKGAIFKAIVGMKII